MGLPRHFTSAFAPMQHRNCRYRLLDSFLIQRYTDIIEQKQNTMSYKTIEAQSPVSLSEIRSLVKEEASFSLNGQSNSARVAIQLFGERIGRNWLKPHEPEVIMTDLFESVRQATQRAIAEKGLKGAERHELLRGMETFIRNVRTRVEEGLSA